MGNTALYSKSGEKPGVGLFRIITGRFIPLKECSGCFVHNVFYLQCKTKLILLVNRFLLVREVVFFYTGVIVVIEIVRTDWIGMYLEE